MLIAKYFFSSTRMYCCLALVLAISSISLVSAADFSCKNSTDFICSETPKNGNWITGRGHVGEDLSVKTDPNGNDWLELTKPQAQHKGFTYFNEAFDSSDGLVIEFEFSATEGWGNLREKQPADGFSVFLFDATTEHFKLGQYGGSLGYGWGEKRRIGDGLRNGYLGVGFDSYGNFSTNIGGSGDSYNRKKDHIVIRGSQKDSYKYIASTRVSAIAKDKYASHKPYPKKAKISLIPTSNGQYRVKASIQGDASTPEKTITRKAPTKLKLGFAASTGSNWARQMIRNIKVSRPVSLQLEHIKTEFDMDGKIRYTLRASNSSKKSGGKARPASIDLNDNDFWLFRDICG